MRVYLTFAAVLLSLVSFSFGQKKTFNTDAQQKFAQKQIELLRLKYQIKDIDMAAVRVFLRYRIAFTLWQKNNSENFEAKEVAIEAFSDLQENKATIPDLYYRDFNSKILALLESNAPEAVAKLQKKYDLQTNQDEIGVAYSLLGKKDSASLAFTYFRKSLKTGQEINPMTHFFLSRLQSEKSLMFPVALSEILDIEEKANGNSSAETLVMLVDYFRDSSVSAKLWNRFVATIGRTAQKILMTPEANVRDAYNLVNAVILDVEQKSPPAIFAELNAIKSALGARASNAEKEAEKAYQRIEESDDKLSETIAQAESVESEQLKQELFNDAAILALKGKKFSMAVDLIEKINYSENSASQGWHDQFLHDVIENALRENDIDSAQLASSRITRKLPKALSQQKIGIHHFKSKDFISSESAFENALKLIAENEEGAPKINAYLNLLSDCVKSTLR